jgi:hypothetical protein
MTSAVWGSPLGEAPFLGPNGEPLAGGKVRWLDGAGTARPVFGARVGLVPLPDPVLLDSTGRPVNLAGDPVQVFGQGSFQREVRDCQDRLMGQLTTVLGAAGTIINLLGLWCRPYRVR